MSTTQSVNFNNNEIGGQNDTLTFISMTEGSASNIPQSFIDKGATTRGQGTVGNFNAAAKTFDYTCVSAEIPPLGQPDLLVYVPIDVVVQNGVCECPQTTFACIRIEAANCDGYDPGSISTSWSCNGVMGAVDLNDFFGSAGAGSSWSASAASITAVSGAGSNPANGMPVFDGNAVTGYTPTAAEIAAGNPVQLGVTITPDSPNQGCQAVFTLTVNIEDPCSGVSVFPVDLT